MARYFDGTSDHIEIADHAALTWPESVSIAGWFRIDSNVTNGRHGFMTWGAFAATPSCALWYHGPSHPTQANKLWIQTKDDGGDIIQEYSSDSAISLDTWHHLTITIAPSEIFGKILRLHLDGVEDANDDIQIFNGMNAAASWMLGDADGPAGAHFYGDMAEWAKWDVVLSTEQISALADGVRPPEVGTRPAWYMPMLAGLEEEIAGIAVTNNGTTIAEHPPAIIRPGIPHVLQPIWPKIGGPYQVLAAATHAAGAADGQIFPAGTTIGQVNEQ